MPLFERPRTRRVRREIAQETTRNQLFLSEALAEAQAAQTNADPIAEAAAQSRINSLASSLLNLSHLNPAEVALREADQARIQRDRDRGIDYSDS